MPPLAVLRHEGRRSGRAYETPVQAYRTPGGFIVGLAYSDNPNWVRNILASGTGEITRGRHNYTISNPRRRGPDARRELAKPVAAMMRLLGIDNYFQFDCAPTKE
nr:nitroreductase family deazaflavin-dependent oxidoreductase [Rhodococcus sp. (in: high G+C Gram-positive bacteria)]